MNRQGSVAGDETLVFQPFEKLLNGSVLSPGRVTVELVLDLAGRHPILPPKQLDDSQFGIGQGGVLQVASSDLEEYDEWSYGYDKPSLMSTGRSVFLCNAWFPLRPQSALPRRNS
jgi:hypothetical protein